MMDKDKVLPRLTAQEIDAIVDSAHAYRIQLGRLGMEQLEQVVEAQRDADLKRVEPLVNVILKLQEEYFIWDCYDDSPAPYAEELAKALAGLGIEVQP